MLCCDQETCWYNFKDILPSSKGNFKKKNTNQDFVFLK